MTEISKNVQEKRLKWYGHVVRKEDKHIIHRALDMKVEGARASGRLVRLRHQRYEGEEPGGY